MRALLSTMQRGCAFRAGAVEYGAGRQRSGAVIATRCRHGLYEAREPGAGYIDRRTRTGRFRARPVTVGASVWRTVAVKVSVLAVLTIGVHAESKNSCSELVFSPGADGESPAISYWMSNGKTAAASGARCAVAVLAGCYTPFLPRNVSAVQSTFYDGSSTIWFHS